MVNTPRGIQQGQTLAEYVRNLWGADTTFVPQQIIPVLTTPTRVTKNNPRRFALIVVNRGGGQVDLDWNPSMALGTGIPLTALGGSLTLTAFEDGELCAYDLYAISSAVGNSLAVYEIQTT